MDDMLEETENLFPGFGGLYLDEPRGTMYVYVTGGKAAPRGLEKAITQVFGKDRLPLSNR